MAAESEQDQRIRQLAAIVEIARRVGVARLSDAQLRELPRLYRHASTRYARLRARSGDSTASRELGALLVRAHGLLYRGRRRARAPLWRRLLDYYRIEVPRALRANRLTIAAMMLAFYGTAALAYGLVLEDIGRAPSLLDPRAVAHEIDQLRAAAESGEAFRGNFTFGWDESASSAGRIIGNNLRVSLYFFVLGLLLPLFLWIFLTNSLMVGTYTGVAAHFGQAGSISSILWCHGVLELQAIVLAGAAGVALLRPWIQPGPWTRGEAIRRGARVAWTIWAPVVPMLIAAGLIEGFVSPHASFGVRVAVAIATGLAWLAWVLFSGRSDPASDERDERALLDSSPGSLALVEPL